MAFDSAANIGSAFSTTANQASLVMTLSVAANVNNLVVLLIAVDNAQTTTGPSTAVSGVTSSVANTWTRAVGFANAPGGVAQGGADISVWYSRISTQIPSAGTITATFANAALADATAMVGTKWSVLDQVEIAATNTRADTAAVMGSLDATTINVECLRVRAVASESNVNAFLVVTAGWTRFGTGLSGAGTSDTEMAVRGEWRVSTGTSDPSIPTAGAGVCDHASAYVAFKEAVSYTHLTLPTILRV